MEPPNRNVESEATVATELELIERRDFVIPAEHWDEFLDWLSRPPKFCPKLHALMRSKAPWDKPASQD
jgi:uncharacterized protein (DUF1778 family)